LNPYVNAYNTIITTLNFSLKFLKHHRTCSPQYIHFNL